jgi:hypothetical protein
MAGILKRSHAMALRYNGGSLRQRSSYFYERTLERSHARVAVVLKKAKQLAEAFARNARHAINPFMSTALMRPIISFSTGGFLDGPESRSNSAFNFAVAAKAFGAGPPQRNQRRIVRILRVNLSSLMR